jgi:hypothetical protein
VPRMSITEERVSRSLGSGSHRVLIKSQSNNPEKPGVKGDVILSAAFHAFTTPASDPPGQLEIYQPRLEFGVKGTKLTKRWHLEAACRSLLDQFRDWQVAIEKDPASIFKSLNPRLAAAMCLLHMYHKMATILLETLLTQSQMIYDQHDSAFAQVLRLAEQLINESHNTGSIISFDMG